ncbi:MULTISPECIES: hypothetical protein [Saccharothrix]|uniref:hypothetical protein n=1 Tax=Saccharothrix TaxID=2071 RepID=UPI00093C7BB4|nr:hypothetical protein [Saccharothrix sp. CB00851]OKI24916.1 hypothetical protein A6A25_33475 [Saccharothrix sp. CB00851]
MVATDTEVAPLLFLEGACAFAQGGRRDAVALLGEAVELSGAAGTAFDGDRAVFPLVHALAVGFCEDERSGIAVTERYLVDARVRRLPWASSWALWARGLVPLVHGRLEDAVPWFQEAVRAQDGIDEPWMGARGIEALAWALAAVGAAEHDESSAVTAATLLGGVIAVERTTGAAFADWLPFRRERAKTRDAVVAVIGERAGEQAGARGASLSSAQLRALALDPRIAPAGDSSPTGCEEAPVSGARTTLPSLSSRHSQVALLVAVCCQGGTDCSSRRDADELLPSHDHFNVFDLAEPGVVEQVHEIRAPVLGVALLPFGELGDLIGEFRHRESRDGRPPRRAAGCHPAPTLDGLLPSGPLLRSLVVDADGGDRHPARAEEASPGCEQAHQVRWWKAG